MKKYKHSISVTETIIEFLNIILCLFSPFNIPTIVFETKNIGAESEDSLMYNPKSSL